MGLSRVNCYVAQNASFNIYILYCIMHAGCMVYNRARDVRLSPPKLESWRIAGSDDSAWNRWLSAVLLDTVQTLPQDIDLLKWQLCKDPKLRWTAARLVSGLMKQHSAQAEPDSTGVARVGNMKKRTLDPRSISERRGKKNN
jgi:hypothetical protein